MRKKRILAGIMSLLLIFTSVFTGNVEVRASASTGNMEIKISGNGYLDYTFYSDENATNQCAGGAGYVDYSKDGGIGTVRIPNDAKKVNLKARGAEGYILGSFTTGDSGNYGLTQDGLFSEKGQTISVSAGNAYDIEVTFTQSSGGEGGSTQNKIELVVKPNLQGSVGNCNLEYDQYDSSDNKLNGSGSIGFSAADNGSKTQNINVESGASYLKFKLITAGASVNSIEFGLNGATPATFDESNNAALLEGTFSVNVADTTKIEFCPALSASGGSVNPPTVTAGDISISVNRAQGTSVAYYRIGDSGEFTKINGSSLTLSASSEGELKNVISGTKIYFKADIDNSQVLDVNNQNWYRVGDSDTPFDLTKLKNGEAYLTYDPNNTYNVQIAFDGGNGGGEQQNVSFSCSSMNGNESARVSAVEVQMSGSSAWVAYSSGALNELREGDTFKARIKMNNGFTIDKVSLDYESFDGNSRVRYFKESEKPNYAAIIAALLSSQGYVITFQPEEASKNADGSSTLDKASACLRLQYQTAIAYEESVGINWFFQTKNGDNDYGVWTIDDNTGDDVFVDGVGDSEVIFSFNDNNYGENGDPFVLGYGVNNIGDNRIQVSYVSAYAGKAGETVNVIPKTYDHFSAGGHATGTNKNTIHLDDYDGLIDEVYIDVNGNNTFEVSEKLTAKDGDDPNIGPYSYYEETLDAAASYNILVRKHLSTRVSLKWSYTGSGTDFYVDHGKIFIEKVVRGEDTLYQAQVNANGDLVLDEQGVPIATTNSLGRDYGVNSSAGEVFLECGDVVTIRLIPTYGYQIESATLNGVVQLTPNETVVSSFTFTVGGNLHMAGTFVEATDETDTTGTTKIKDAGITDGQNATDSGNLKLTVEDHSGTYANESEALNLAKGDNENAKTIATLDMTLDSMVSKGNGEYWSENISEFEDPINVNLELNDESYVPGDTYVVVREHEGQLEKLTTTYSNGMLEVPTNKFSTYSIVKIPVAPENAPNMKLWYDARQGEEEGSAGSVTVSVVKDANTNEPVPMIAKTEDGEFYKYNSSDRIVFELKRPKDRDNTEEQTFIPIVDVVFPQENTTIEIQPTVVNDSFMVIPNSIEGLSGSPYMEVYVWWSEYDRFGPNQDEFMIILNQSLGGGSFEFQNGLTPKKIATLDNESKYIFNNETEVSVELKPDENKELAEVFLFQGEQGIHYSGEPDVHQGELEEQRNIEELKVADKYILSGLGPWAFVDAIFIDIPVLSDIVLNTTGTLYDSMKGSDISVSSTCKIGEDVINGTTKLKDQDSYLLEGINNYAVVFTSTPDEHREQFTVEGTISLTVEHNAVTSINITTQPTKTSYIYGESFDKTGLKVTATFADASIKDVTDDVTFEGDIVPSNTTIKAVYTKDEVTVKADVAISVSHATIDISTLKWTGTTFEYNGTAQGPTFSSTLPTGVAVELKTGVSNTAVGNYSAVAKLKLADGYSKEYYRLVNTSGTEEITVAADGATATVTQAWSISAKALASADITLGGALTYNGESQTQTIASVKVDGRTLTEGTDYTVSGNIGTNVNSYTLTITGKGNYTGTATKDWSIGKKSISGATITLGDALTYIRVEQTQTVSIVKLGESTLTATTDYTISGNVQKDAGTYTLIVTGNGNYEGTVTKEFTISKATLVPTLSGTTTKVYDNTVNVTATGDLTLNVTGLMNSETVTVTATGYTYDNANVGSGKTITASGISISGDAAKNYVLSKTTATVAGGTITQATPTITLSNLTETTQAPTGVKAILSPTDETATVKIEYEVLDTPAVAAKPEVPCNVTHEENCVSLKEGKTIVDCTCTTPHKTHTDDCGYKAAVPAVNATYKWVETRPTDPGTYKVRASLPTGTTNLAAVTTFTEGTYTLTKYTAPSGGGSNNNSGTGSGSSSGSTSSDTANTNIPVLVETITATTPKTETNTQTKPVKKNEQTNTETTTETEKPIGVTSGEGSEGWTDIKTEIFDKLEEATETVEVVVEMNGEDTVPADIFESIKGQDVTVSFDMGNGIVWAVNGMDITGDNLESINFSASTGSGVTVIPTELISSLGEDRFTMELTLEHEGEFGFTAVMTVNVDQKNAGKYANLFYFNPTDEAMEFICSAPVNEDGTADLTFVHASDYVIVVDEASMSEEHNISLANVRETASEETPEEVVIAVNDTWNPIWIIAIGAAILVIGGIVVFTVKKKHD